MVYLHMKIEIRWDLPKIGLGRIARWVLTSANDVWDRLTDRRKSVQTATSVYSTRDLLNLPNEFILRKCYAKW